MKLSKEAQKLYNVIKDEYGISDEAGLLLLKTSMESFDLMRSAQKQIEKEGLIIRDRFDQLKNHPAVIVLRDSKSAMLQSLKNLNLDFDPATKIRK